MLRYRRNTIGADINQHNISYCLALGYQASLINNDALNFKGSSFDSALLDNVLEHIEKPHNILQEISRILKPNGCLIVGVPGAKGFESDSDHKHFYDEQALRKTAKDANFKITRFFYTPLFKSELLSKLLRQYCIYSIWQKV